MSHLNRTLHRMTQYWCQKHHRQFLSATEQLETVQTQKLKQLLSLSHTASAHAGLSLSPRMTWRDFASDVPISQYDTWKPWITSDRDTGINTLIHSPIQRFQPTSGSTSAIKWIPYSQIFLDEINAALMAWIGDLYQSHGAIRHGYHYWSVSWIPNALRDEVDDNVNDDLTVLPWWKRWIAGQFMAVPDTVAQAHTSEDTLFASLAYLLSRRDLTMLSVWSPTFALSLIEQITEHRDELIDVLSQGKWLDRAGSLQHSPCPTSPSSAQLLAQLTHPVDTDFLSALWPDLALISSWDTASSQHWAKKLHALFPQATFQGKGLWATEGVVTIPFGHQYPLAVNSHYYEFMDLSNDTVLPAWELETGMEVSPLLTTGSGFLRYQLNDKLRVNGFINQCPCFEFIGRIDGTDLTGEKISSDVSLKISHQLAEQFSVTPVSLVAIPGHYWHQVFPQDTRGCYVFLCEPTHPSSLDPHTIATALEHQLQKNFHYQLARELNQLAPAQVIVNRTASDLYMYRCLQRGMAKGNIKIEPLVLWDTPLPPAFARHLHPSHTPTISPVSSEVNP